MCKAPKSASTARSPGACSIIDTTEIAAFADDLVVLDRNPAEMRLSWRYGISKNVLEKKLRTGEVANWLQYQVLPTRAKRGRG